MIRIEGGEFFMGAEGFSRDEEPVHLPALDVPFDDLAGLAHEHHVRREQLRVVERLLALGREQGGQRADKNGRCGNHVRLPLLEDDPGGQHDQTETDDIVPAQRLVEIEHGKEAEYAEGDDFLNGLEFRGVEVAVADAVCRYLKHVLEKGDVVETGNHETLINEKGLYYAMWRQQIGERKKTFAAAS